MKVMQKMLVSGNQDEAEDFEVAMSLLNRYQQNRDCFKVDEDLEKKRKQLFNTDFLSGSGGGGGGSTVKNLEPMIKKPSAPVLNPALVQDMRHAEIDQKRQKRKEQAEATKSNPPAAAKSRQPQQPKQQDDSDFHQNYQKIQAEIKKQK